MKTVILLASLLASTTAFAYERGTAVIDLDTGARARIGTGCRLTIDGRDVTRGKCNVARSGSLTVIDTGDVDYKIDRDTKYSATFQTRTGKYIDSVTTEPGSSCWTGDRVRFCAH